MDSEFTPPWQSRDQHWIENNPGRLGSQLSAPSPSEHAASTPDPFAQGAPQHGGRLFADSRRTERRIDPQPLGDPPRPGRGSGLDVQPGAISR